MEVQFDNAFSAAAFALGPPSDSDFAARRPRITAGNGINMAEKIKKLTHKKAKGRTIHAKPTRRTTRGRGVRSSRRVNLQKTAPAQAEQKAQPAAENQQPDNNSPATGSRPGDTEKHGLELLMEAVDSMMCHRSKTIAETLATQIANGNAGCAKVVVGLAEKMQRKLQMEKNQEKFRNMIKNLGDEPEFEDPEEQGAETGKPQAGDIETIHAVEECASAAS